MRKWLGALVALVLVVAACGGDSGGSDDGEPAGTSDASTTDETPQTQPPDTEGSDDPGSAGGLPPGGTGTVTIDGETIDAEWVGNCMIDEQFDPHPDDLDLTASLGSGIDALFVRVSYQEAPAGLMGGFNAEIQRRGDDGEFDFYEMTNDYLLAPDGNWYQDDDGALMVQLLTGRDLEAEPLAEAPISIEGDRLTGTVAMAMEGSTEAIDVSFDLEVAEAVDCSLGS